MEAAQKHHFEDFTAAALVLLVITCVAVVLSSVTQLAVKNPWPQVLFLQVFQHKGMGLLAVVLTPQALFSPITTLVVASLLPLFLHILCLVILWSVVWSWNIKARLVYFCMALVPVFGPVAAQTLMKSMGEIKD